VTKGPRCVIMPYALRRPWLPAAALGWEVRVLEGLDHTQAMQAVHVLPILRPWLVGRLGRCGSNWVLAYFASAVGLLLWSGAVAHS
jgi:hypothetical protein